MSILLGEDQSAKCERYCMDFQNFLKLQKEKLVQEFSNEMSTCLISTTPERIVRHAKEYDWKINTLKRSKPTSAFILQKPGNIPEIWVNRTYTCYRRAFLEYLQMSHNFKGEYIPTQWQVDHLQSTHRFKKSHPTYFIRLYLIDRAINASYGAGFEKMFYRDEREKEPNGGIHMDWLTFLKAYGERLPGKSKGSHKWAIWSWRLAVHLASKGIEDKVLAYTGISTVLNLGYTGRYFPLPLHTSFKKEALSHPTIQCVPMLNSA